MSYPIGTPGQAWQQEHKIAWREQQTIKRSYQEQVVTKIQALKQDLAAELDVIQYGALTEDSERYPLFVMQSKNFSDEKPTVLVTGGVHGYETSGVQGALLFVKTKLKEYMGQFNLVVFPCVSPWGYETINRWNPLALDPNRSFYADSPSEESAAVMKYCEDNNIKPICHVDLHETTDTDNSEFRPALAARDGIVQKTWNIPDGFYCVGDTSNPQDAFQTAIIKEVEKVTHIAPADEHDQLIGVDMEQKGVINYDKKALGLCGGFTNAEYVSTTEVYPDSPLVDDENCNLAQVAAVVGAIEYIKAL
jgi:hypothetical protein